MRRRLPLSPAEGPDLLHTTGEQGVKTHEFRKKMNAVPRSNHRCHLDLLDLDQVNLGPGL